MTPEQLLEQLTTANQTIEEQKERIARMEARISWLEKSLFDTKSEKNVVPPPPASPQLDVFGEQGEATDEEIKEESKEPEKKKKRRKPRQPLPQNLPRKKIVHDLPEEEKACTCCGKPMRCIGEDVSEKLEVIPAQFFVEVHHRPRYACGSCKENVAQAPLP